MAQQAGIRPLSSSMLGRGPSRRPPDAHGPAAAMPGCWRWALHQVIAGPMPGHGLGADQSRGKGSVPGPTSPRFEATHLQGCELLTPKGDPGSGRCIVGVDHAEAMPPFAGATRAGVLCACSSRILPVLQQMGLSASASITPRPVAPMYWTGQPARIGAAGVLQRVDLQVAVEASRRHELAPAPLQVHLRHRQRGTNRRYTSTPKSSTSGWSTTTVTAASRPGGKARANGSTANEFRVPTPKINVRPAATGRLSDHAVNTSMMAATAR